MIFFFSKLLKWRLIAKKAFLIARESKQLIISILHFNTIGRYKSDLLIFCNRCWVPLLWDWCPIIHATNFNLIQFVARVSFVGSKIARHKCVMAKKLSFYDVFFIFRILFDIFVILSHYSFLSIFYYFGK